MARGNVYVHHGRVCYTLLAPYTRHISNARVSSGSHRYIGRDERPQTDTQLPIDADIQRIIAEGRTYQLATTSIERRRFIDGLDLFYLGRKIRGGNQLGGRKPRNMQDGGQGKGLRPFLTLLGRRTESPYCKMHR